MLDGFVRSFKLPSTSRACAALAAPLRAGFGRAGIGIGAVGILLIAGANAVHDATASNETRTLSFHHTHSGEDLTVTFKRNGRYDDEALGKLNHFLRDWRSQEKTTMDRALFDIIWEVYRDVDAVQPIQIISAYRSPATNAMLRRRSSGVARFSQHMQGHAMDFFIPGVALADIRSAGLRLQRGGVGFYPTSCSPFVHLDTGSIRHWPRMTHDQLARVFPNGRTVHVPSDGRPLSGYELAMADVQKRGSNDELSARAKPSLFTSLFSGGPATHKHSDDEDEGPAAAEARPLPGQKPSAASLMAALPARTEPVPVPRAKPAMPAQVAVAKPARPDAPLQLASADQDALPLPAAVTQSPASGAPRPPADIPVADRKNQTPPQTPADIINARGFWDDMPTAPKQATPAQVAALSARQALSAVADPQSTASVGSSVEQRFQAFAYAPAAAEAPPERAPVIAASLASVPRNVRTPARNPMAVTSVTTVVGKRGGVGVVNAARLAAAGNRDNSVWMRAMVLAPRAADMHATVMGDPDMTLMRAHFVKPTTAIAAGFTDDPHAALPFDRFDGAATARLSTVSFVTRTAALR